MAKKLFVILIFSLNFYSFSQNQVKSFLFINNSDTLSILLSIYESNIDSTTQFVIDPFSFDFYNKKINSNGQIHLLFSSAGSGKIPMSFSLGLFYSLIKEYVAIGDNASNISIDEKYCLFAKYMIKKDHIKILSPSANERANIIVNTTEKK